MNNFVHSGDLDAFIHGRRTYCTGSWNAGTKVKRISVQKTQIRVDWQRNELNSPWVTLWEGYNIHDAVTLYNALM